MENKTQYTDEQKEIIFSEGDIKINAVAGAGKTTTLVGYAKEREDQKILYLGFNRTVKEEAQKKFSELRNVKVETAHSLAYKHIVKMGYRLAERFTLTDIMELLNIPKRPDTYALAYHINKYISAYCNSDVISMKQLDYLSLVEEDSLDFVKNNYDAIMVHSRTILQKMNSREIQMTHDFYLKKFQTIKPILDYDIILLDEAQDTSPVMLDIFKSQKAKKVAVGDTHQQIYGWRHAVNSIEKLDFRNYNLSTSFRFDENIALLAKHILSTKDGIDVAIHGAGTFNKDKKKKAFLGRTNVGLISKALQEDKAKIHFEGNIHSYLRNDNGVSIYDILNLKQGKLDWIKDPVIKNLKTIDKLTEYIEQSGDRQLKPLVDIVNIYDTRLPFLLRELVASHVEKEDADYIFSTVHKSKGMEYDFVEMLDDFSNIKELTIEDNEEINLIYVAATRTKSSLIINDNQIPTDYNNKAMNVLIKKTNTEDKRNKNNEKKRDYNNEKDGFIRISVRK